jgi:hypothetical protein
MHPVLAFKLGVTGTQGTLPRHLRAIFMHTMPFMLFQKVLDDLCLEEIQQGIQGLPTAASTPTAFYATQKHPSSSSVGGQECPTGQ